MIRSLVQIVRGWLRVAWMGVVAADVLALEILKRYQRHGRLILRLGRRGPKLVVKKKPERAA